jgi:hypothetical protein
MDDLLKALVNFFLKVLELRKRIAALEVFIIRRAFISG